MVSIEVSSTHGGKSLVRAKIDEDEMLLARSSNTELNLSYNTDVEFGLICQNNSIWYLNIRDSNHICGDENMFDELSKIEAGHVSFGDAHFPSWMKYDMFFSEEWMNWKNLGPVLRTRPQK